MASCRPKTGQAGDPLLPREDKRRWKLVSQLFYFQLITSSREGSGPHSEVVLHRGNPWPGRGKAHFHGPVPKISLIYELLDEQPIRY